MKQFIDPSLLEDNCHSKSKEDYTVKLTDEDKLMLREQLADDIISKGKRAKLLKTFGEILKMDGADQPEMFMNAIEKAALKPAGIKTITKAIAAATDLLDKGYKEVFGTVYLMDDMESGMMGIYTPDGNLLYSRKLKPEEKQLTIFSKIANVN